MKKLIQIIPILFLFVLNLESQNLIPNSGFDIISDCPTDIDQIEFAPPWTTAATEPPILFHECSSDHRLGVPSAGLRIDSYQSPRSGGGYAGIFVYREDNWNTYTYLGTPLSKSLIQNAQYYVEFFVSPDLTPLNNWSYTDAVGLAFTDSFY